MNNKKNKHTYYCFECQYAKSKYGALICQIYKGDTEMQNKACVDFKLKKDFVRRKKHKKKWQS